MELEMQKVYANYYSGNPKSGISYEEFKKYYCPNCTAENCIHRECYRRVPKSIGGLGLCPNLRK